MHSQKKYNRRTRFNMRKLANVLFTYELQRKLENTGSTAIAAGCHPGVSTTELLRYAPRLLLSLTAPLVRLVKPSAEDALPTLSADRAGRERPGLFLSNQNEGIEVLGPECRNVSRV